MRALRGFFRSRETERLAGALYARAVEQGRQPGFYAALTVPDTVDGRFEMIALHVWLLLHRLREGDSQARALAQAVFDAMFQDMDRALREMGAGDLGVGRRVKAMATAFYGRIAAYDRGLASGGQALDDALIRNVWRGDAPDGARVAALARYLRGEVAALSEQPLERLLSGEAAFGKAPATVDDEA